MTCARHERNGAHTIDCVYMEVRERRKFEEALLQARQAADRANIELDRRRQEAEQSARLLESQALELELQHQQLEEQATESRRELPREAADHLRGSSPLKESIRCSSMER